MIEFFNELEPLVLMLGIVYWGYFLYKDLTLLSDYWPQERIKTTRLAFMIVSLINVIMLLVTMHFLADYYVRTMFIYGFYYFMLGLAWIYLNLHILRRWFDLSWQYDAIQNNNKAALVTVLAVEIGATILYCGTSIGDGPGVGCVIFTLLLGLGVWLVLCFIIGKLTDIFERITVERDVDCAIRFGAFLIAAGIILGRACAGNWTSYNATIYEFLVMWPLIPLVAAFIIGETQYFNKEKDPIYENEENNLSPKISMLYGLLLIVLAIVIVILLPPLPGNHMQLHFAYIAVAKIIGSIWI